MESHPLLLALIAGLVSGFLVSIPVGPINVTIVNEAAYSGFRKAFLIGIGSVVMEVIYSALGFAGFSSFFNFIIARAALELLSFLLMLYLGLKYLLAREIAGSPAIEQKIERRLHPHTAFMIGFVRTLGNPAILLLWVTLAATFAAHEWVSSSDASRLACITGIGLGALLWFTLLSFFVSRGQRRITNRGLLRLSRISGAGLLLLALLAGGRLVLLLAERHLPPKFERFVPRWRGRQQPRLPAVTAIELTPGRSQRSEVRDQRSEVRTGPALPSSILYRRLTHPVPPWSYAGIWCAIPL